MLAKVRYRPISPHAKFWKMCVVLSPKDCRKYRSDISELTTKNDASRTSFEFALNRTRDGEMPPELRSLTVLANSLCSSGKLRKISELARTIEKKGVKLDVVFYSSWINECLRNRKVGKAFSIAQEMLEKGVSFDVICYSILIDGVSKTLGVEKTIGFIKKMKAQGLEPNVVTLTSIMSGFCKKNMIEQSFALLKLSEEMGIQHDEHIYNVLIDGLCKMGDITGARQLFAEMQQRGISPSAASYNALIHGLCLAGRASDAEEVSNSVEGDAITFTTLLNGFLKEENSVGILRVKNRLQNSRVEFDTVLCNMLIKALFMVGESKEATMIYKRMSALSLVPDAVTYFSMIDGLCKNGEVSEALELLNASRKMGFFSPSCYLQLLSCLCKNGEADRASQLFIDFTAEEDGFGRKPYETFINDFMQQKGPDEVVHLLSKLSTNVGRVFDLSIRLLRKHQFLYHAKKLLIMARKAHFILSSKSYFLVLQGLINNRFFRLSQPVMASFIKEYGHMDPLVGIAFLHFLFLKDANNAFFLYEKLKEDNQNRSFPFAALKSMRLCDASVIVEALCMQGGVLEALEICMQTQRKDIHLSIVTYNKILHGLFLQGCVLEACRLFDSLERIGVAPSDVTYEIMVNGLCREGRLSDSTRYMEKMGRPNKRIYNSMIYGYCKFDQIEEAMKMLREMKSKGILPNGFTVSCLIDGYARRGDMEGALDLYMDYRVRVLPDLLGFVVMMRGLCYKGRMEEARGVFRDLLHCPYLMQLINSVKVGDELESNGSMLRSLCEEGNIDEAILVLTEVYEMLEPVNPFAVNGGLYFPGFGFNSYYQQCVSLCLNGKVEEANIVVREMILNMN